MDLHPLVQEFLTYLDAEKGYSPHTISSYRSDLRQWLTHLTDAGVAADIDRITVPVIRGVVQHLHQRKLAPATIGRRINCLRSLWTYLLENDYVDHDPFRGVAIPKRRRPAPVHLTAPECAALLQATERQSSPLLAFRNRAVLSVLIHAGLRRAEVLALRLGAVDLDEALLVVESGKGRKPRLVPLGAQVVRDLRDWLELRPETGHDHVFTSIVDRPLGRKGLMGLLARAVRRTGITKASVTLHTLRHTFACLMLQGGCDLFALSQLMGHTRLDTTATYLHATLGDLRGAVEGHPLSAG